MAVGSGSSLTVGPRRNGRGPVFTWETVGLTQNSSGHGWRETEGEREREGGGGGGGGRE